MGNHKSGRGVDDTRCSHVFLDEAGDTTFYGRNKTPLVGTAGVSRYFILGILSVRDPLERIRDKVLDLQHRVSIDPYFNEVPSIQKKKKHRGYYFHAKDDVPEVRKMVFEFIKTTNCRFDAVVGRKIYHIYENKHHGSQSAFYADMLSHLLHNHINSEEKLVLNIAHRSRCTTHANLEKGLKQSLSIAQLKNNIHPNETVFNIQYPTSEPLINLADYFLWALQRKMERNENRYWNFLECRIGKVNFLYTTDTSDV